MLIPRTLALWLAPLPFTYSRSIAVPVAHHELHASSEPSAQPFTGPEVESNFAAFNVACQEDDEAFDFSFRVLEPSNDAACGSSSILINGQPLDQDWTNPQWLQSGEGRSNITVASSLNNLNHTLQLSSKSVCLSSTLTGSGNSPFPANDGDAVQITFVHIESIDGRPSLSRTGFTVSFDHKSQQIIGVLPTTEQASSISHEDDSDDGDSATTISDDPSIEDSPALSAQPSIDDESHKLRYLQNELDALILTVHNQKAVVDDLYLSQDSDTVVEVKECHSAKCIAQTIFQKARHCVRFVIVKLTSKPNPSRQTDVDPDCYWTHSRQARMYAAMKGEKLCAGEQPTAQSVFSPSVFKPSSFKQSSSLSTSPDSSPKSDETEHPILVPLSVIASLFCLSCLLVKMQRNCCNPRARAERAARCEERRTRRQYARLARQHRWRTWWNQRLGRNSKPFSSDYEEKRSLIQAQEQVLERAMQNEICQIRNQHGYFDEEAAAGPSESLPPYRSRAGSGRPPSYTSEPVENTVSPTMVGSLVSDVTSGLVDGPPRTPMSDMTPDSSIANLSRRNSSDTLHSEVSLV